MKSGGAHAERERERKSGGRYWEGKRERGREKAIFDFRMNEQHV